MGFLDFFKRKRPLVRRVTFSIVKRLDVQYDYREHVGSANIYKGRSRIIHVSGFSKGVYVLKETPDYEHALSTVKAALDELGLEYYDEETDEHMLVKIKARERWF
ncbi:MAG: hypothetical protein ACE5J7_04210 [Candidatus Aenigmatarchaeota archaeon]